MSTTTLMSALKEDDEPPTIEIDPDQKSRNLAEAKAIEQREAANRRLAQASGAGRNSGSGQGRNNNGDIRAYRPILAKYFPSHAIPAAELVIGCESGGDERIISATGDHGLFQINRSAHAQTLVSYGKSMKDMLDAEQNIWYASLLYKSSGWGPWYMSNDCHGLLNH